MNDESAVTEAARPASADLARGTNQSGVRLYNERLVLSLIRRHRSLPKAEIARLTGLSAQTISVIIRQLEADGLVRKEEKQRGRVGQPSVPFSLDPDGAYFLGVKIGRRSSDLVLMDFVGAIRQALHETYHYPTPAGVLAFVGEGTRDLVASLPRRHRERVSGLGIAAPFELWNWAEQIGAPRHVLDEWRSFDISGEIGRICRWPVYFCNDATAACGAELVLGNPSHTLDFLYFYIGSFVGGGVVLNGGLYPGRTGNAGALGSLPVAGTGPVRGGPEQLIRSASLYVLEEQLLAAGLDPAVLWRSPDDWGDLGQPLEGWVERAAESLAFAGVAAISVIDFQAIVIDGALPAGVRARLVERTTEKMGGYDRQGLSPVIVVAGSIGSAARAVGGACLPLLANFTRDREVLFKTAS